jgi:hypothetical protein
MPAERKTGASFTRHVAPFAPVALALAMNAAHPARPPATPATSASNPSNVVVKKGTFQPVCPLPFKGVRNSAADDHCGIQGGSPDSAKQAESMSKNNFCAAKQAPETFVYQNFVDLQSKSKTIPTSIPDRKVVESLGEGKYVTYIAFVKDAHYSDVDMGEAVNCNIPGNDTNDIHIVLMPDTNFQDECRSTTAEMSPHYRPSSWTPENILKAAAGHPVRIQGHLFYDGSHTPCAGTARPTPNRISLWEIHPVYSFEVCNLATIPECQGNAAQWTPLERMFASEPAQ